MATVQLQVRLPPNFHDAFAATWDILDDQLRQVASGSFLAMPSAQAVLGPGNYYARLRLPNNETETRRFEVVGERSVGVDFVLTARSQHEWLAWTSLGESPEQVDGAIDSPLLRDVWVRAWSFEREHWAPADYALAGDFHTDGRRMQIELRSSAPRLFALQVGGERINPRVVVLPPGNTARVLITAHPSKLPGTHRIELMVSLANSVADHLVRYLSIGGSASSLGIEASLAQAQSRDLLLEKYDDPLGAAVGAYFLVSQGSAAPLDWLRRLAGITWLPDGAIICAYALLKSPGPDAIAEATKLLRDAASRGYPVLRIGLEWFLDAQRLLSSSRTGTADKQLAAAAELYNQVRRYSLQQTVFTSFYGLTPAQPGRPHSHLESKSFSLTEAGVGSQSLSQERGVRVLSQT